MALTLGFEICETDNCSSLKFTDTTGAYNASSNPSGYGSTVNNTTSGASATLAITLADGTLNTITLTGFPTTDTTKVFTIDASDLGYSSSSEIKDQIVTALYTVTFADTSISTQTITVALYCQVDCCVKSMVLDLDVDCGDCFNASKGKVTDAYLMLQGLKYAANCGNATVFNKVLTQLNKLCLNSNCSNCK